MNHTQTNDSDFLMDVLQYSDVITELRREALTNDELARSIDVSHSTSYRYTDRLSEMDIVAESGSENRLTHLGETIADEIIDFEITVRQILNLDSDDSDVFVELLRHSPGLQALSRRPLDRRELEDRLGVSNTTGYRISHSLEDRELIEKTNGRYAITTAGEEILEAVSVLESNVLTAVHLDPVLPVLREAGPPIDLDAFAGATITTGSGYTFSPQNRYLDLLEETDTLRCTNIESVVPSYLGDIQEPVYDGVEFEVIKQPEIAAEMLAEFPDRAMEACNRDNVSVYLHDDLWYNLAIFDERIAIGALNTGTGTCHTLVDTGAPAAQTWAEAVYESYKEEAVHLPQFEPITLQRVVETMDDDTNQRVEQR